MGMLVTIKNSLFDALFLVPYIEGIRNSRW